MTRLMYDAPSYKDVDKIIVTDKFIELENQEPKIIKKESNEEVC